MYSNWWNEKQSNENKKKLKRKLISKEEIETKFINLLKRSYILNQAKKKDMKLWSADVRKLNLLLKLSWKDPKGFLTPKNMLEYKMLQIVVTEMSSHKP